MKNESASFDGRENKKLFFQKWLPDAGEIKAYIIAIHGFGTHSDILKIPAQELTEKGYAVYSFDLRGHWRNKGDISGHIDSMDHIQKDLVLFMDIVKEDAKDKKIFLMGDSLGGLISLEYATNRPNLAGVIAVSPLFDLSLNSSFGKKTVKKMVKMAVPTKTEAFNIDYKEITSDLKILRIFHTDKNLTKQISAKTVVDIDTSLKTLLKSGSTILCPILYLQGGNDKFVDVAKSQKFFKSIKSEDKTFKEYDDLLHGLLLEKKRAQVYQDIYIWLEKHIK